MIGFDTEMETPMSMLARDPTKNCNLPLMEGEKNPKEARGGKKKEH